MSLVQRRVASQLGGPAPVASPILTLLQGGEVVRWNGGQNDHDHDHTPFPFHLIGIGCCDTLCPSSLPNAFEKQTPPCSMAMTFYFPLPYPML